jgi:hypothetical protein
MLAVERGNPLSGKAVARRIYGLLVPRGARWREADTGKPAAPAVEFLDAIGYGRR